jgi:hypothetical protein
MSAGGGPRVDGQHNPKMIRLVEQGGAIPGLASRMPGAANGGFGHNLIGTREWRASISYVTGAHNMKIGYQGGFSTPTKDYYYFGEVIAIRMNNGVINQLTQNGAYPAGMSTGRDVQPINFYAQDQWTRQRLTLQGGIRLDNGLTAYPSVKVGGPGFNLMPTEFAFPKKSTQGIAWRDVTPRVGVAYDLFGNGKTALKFNYGKYMEGLSSLFGLDLNPAFRISTSTSRSWTDSNKNFVPDCDLKILQLNGECGQVADLNFGKQVFSDNYDPAFVSGWGNRPWNKSMGISIQQEIAPRVAVNVGYFRNSWGNKSVVDNRATILSDYTPFGIRAPADSRLPGGGGDVVSGLYNVVPLKSGVIDNLTQKGTNFGEQIESWQGVDVNVTARMRIGLTVQGGTSTGRRLTDDCAIRAMVPEAISLTSPYCRVAEPYLTSASGLATYTIPKVAVLVSTTWRSNPGAQIGANYVANNAVIAAGPQPLGRNLSGGAANVTVNLIQPGTLYGARQNNVDFRVAKVLRYGRTRTQISLDLYNLTNTDVVLAQNNTFVPGGAWLTPTRIQPARYMKISGQFDF